MLIPVLLYHSVSDEHPDDSFAVSPARFREHAKAFAASGHTSLTVTELAQALRGVRPLPQRPVVVTFDDGYRDTPRAIETLAGEGVRATLYVTTGRRGLIAPQDVRELARSAPEVEIGAHSVSHARLDELGPDRAAREITDSRDQLEQLLQRPVESFAYPHGAYDRSVRQLVVDAGFSSAAAVKNALSHEGDDPFAIARWTVRRSTTVEDLLAVLDGRAPVAWERERVRTRVYRSVRKLRRRIGPDEPAAPPGAALSDLVVPAAIIDLDITAPFQDTTLGAIDGKGSWASLAVFVRSGSQPLGWISMAAPSSGVVRGETLRAEIAASFSTPPPPSRRSARDPVTTDELISIVIPTCADDDAVVRSITTLMQRAVGPYEIVVVENRPVGSTVRQTLDAHFPGADQIRYVEEEARGLSEARNAGVRAARGAIVAFVDDDILIDRHWMQSLRAAFASHPAAACVTGLILPAELRTESQLRLEQFAGFSKGLETTVFAASDPPRDIELFPYSAGHFGSGANTAFRADALIRLGGFDPALGTGTPARGAEDLDIYVRLIMAGETLVYDPRAIVWHRHPDTPSELRRRAFGYGVGLGAFLTKLFAIPESRRDLISLSARGVIYWVSPRSRKNVGRTHGFPMYLRVLELSGLTAGPLAYARSHRRARPSRVTAPTAGQPAVDEHAIWSGELEITRPRLPLGPLRTADGSLFSEARLLVRVCGAPIGFVEVATQSDGRLDDALIAEVVGDDLGDKITEELARNGVTGGLRGRLVDLAGPERPYWLGSEQPLVTVVLCTRNRPGGARRCLMSLCELSYRNLEIIVVDNGSDEGATQIMVSELQRTRPHIRYVREDRLGLSCARNRGVTEAKGEILAFTDDDVRVDPLWIDGLLRGFARSEDVACVTGLVASSSLQHPAEQYFDGRVWWSSSCCHELHQPPRAGDGGLYPYASGKFGTGANFAFRTAQLRDLGRFDECLGAGSPSSGGEDLDIFVRVLRGGHSLSYEPCALVWHDHRVDERSLKRQMYAYGKGLGAYLTKYLLSPTTGPDVARRLARGLMHGAALANRSTETKRSAGVGPGVLRTEMRGLLAGPPAYLGARLRQGSRRAGPR